MRVNVVFRRLKWAVHSHALMSRLPCLSQHNPVSSVVHGLAVFVNRVLLYRVSWLYCRRVVVLKYWSGLESVRVLDLVARVQRVARLSRAHQFQAQTLSYARSSCISIFTQPVTSLSSHHYLAP
jgi:hypothetical protein